MRKAALPIQSLPRARMTPIPSEETARVSTHNGQLQHLLRTVKAVRRGDFSVRLPAGQHGIIGEIGEVLNEIIELNETMANEFVRVGRIVGQEGKMTERVAMGATQGAWATSVSSVNSLIG